MARGFAAAILPPRRSANAPGSGPHEWLGEGSVAAGSTRHWSAGYASNIPTLSVEERHFAFLPERRDMLDEKLGMDTDAAVDADRIPDTEVDVPSTARSVGCLSLRQAEAVGPALGREEAGSKVDWGPC
jgi:hypothetical protein